MMLTALGLSFGAQAAPVVFTVDPLQSSITISGMVVGSTMNEQAAGSLTTKYGGTINAEIIDSTIQFTGGTVISAQNGGDYQPQANGVAGSAPANYGGAVDIIIASGKAAIRNIQLDLLSAPTSVTDGKFNSDGLVFQFLPNSPASFDYLISGFFFSEAGSEPLAGYSTNHITEQASLVIADATQTLTIPISADVAFGVITEGDSSLSLKGKLVATSAVAPPPIFYITSAAISGGILTLKWQSIPGQQYQILVSPDLKNWAVRAANVMAESDITSWSTPSTNTVEFFRIGR